MNMENEFLEENLKRSEYNSDEINNILSGLKEEKLTTFRVNRIKCKEKKELFDTLDKLGLKYTEYKDIKDAYILDNYKISDGFDSKTGLRIEKLAIYQNGEIYVQSLSSMIPVIALEPKENENILDMCAAPGGKTTMIQSVCNNKVSLTAVELHKDRFEKLKYNLNVQGANVLALNQNALDLDDMFKFDKILLDAPCSGSGTLNINNNKYKDYFTKNLIDKCVKTQKRLIKKSYKLLKNEGVLIYSTCSLLKEENEDIIDFAIKNGFKIDFCKIKNDYNKWSKGSSVNDGVYIKIFPDKLHEGFFVAKLKK